MANTTISNENKAVNLTDLGTAASKIKENTLQAINEPINISNEHLQKIEENTTNLASVIVPPTEITEGKEEVIREPVVADTLQTFTFAKKSAKYLVTNNTSEVIFASMGTTCETGIMIPSECSRVLVADDTGYIGSASVSIMPVASTSGDYDVVEVQQL